MINKHLRRCSTPLVTMKMLIKTSIQCKLKHIYVLLNHRMAKIKKKIVVTPVMARMKRNLLTHTLLMVM